MRKRFSNDKTEVVRKIKTALERIRSKNYDIITIHLGPLIDNPKNIKNKLRPILDAKENSTKTILLSSGPDYIACAKSQVGGEVNYIARHSKFNSELDQVRKEKNFKKRKETTVGDVLYERLKETNHKIIASDEIEDIFYPFLTLSRLMQGYLAVKYIRGELKNGQKNYREKTPKTGEEEIKKILLRNKSNTKIDPINEADKWSWWAGCIGVYDDPEKDRKYCLAHKNGMPYVLDEKFYTKIEELNKNEAVDRALRTRLYAIYGKHSS